MKRAWRRQRPGRALARVAYWLAVVAVACALVFLLLVYLESRDESSVGAERPGSGARFA